VYHEFESPDPIPYDVEGMANSSTAEGPSFMIRGFQVRTEATTTRSEQKETKSEVGIICISQIEKKLEAYDEVNLLFADSGTLTILSWQDATLAIDLLVSLKNCNGRIAGKPYLLYIRLGVTFPR